MHGKPGAFWGAVVTLIALVFGPTGFLACESAISGPDATPSPAPITGGAQKATFSATPAPAATPTPAPTPAPTPTPDLTPNPSPTPIPLLHSAPYTVAIDPGHGGVDYSGAAYRDAAGQVTSEKDLTLDVALRLDALLRAAGYQTVLIRDGDYSLTELDAQDVRGSQRRELQARVDKANEARADILVSIHFNGSDDPSLSGLEVYYNPERSFAEYSWALASFVHDALAKAIFRYGYLEAKDRGIRNDSEVGGDPTNPHSYLLGTNPDFRPSLMPGIIAEPLFLSNEREAKIILNPDFRDALARGLKDGIDAYFAWLQGQITGF